MKKYILFLVSLITIILSITNCSSDDDEDYDSEITKVEFDKKQLNIMEGTPQSLKLTLTPNGHQNKCHVRWEYDNNYIIADTNNYGAVITGKKNGGTYIKATCNGIIATCLISITGVAEENIQDPYIYSDSTVVEIKQGDSAVIETSLYGGTVSDMEFFEWSIKDESIASIAASRNGCVITSKKVGSTTITCSHPNAEYDYTFVVYVYTDKMTEPYITTEFNVFTINKNEEKSRKVSAQLINPISVANQNQFTWRLADEKSKGIIDINANLAECEIIPKHNGIAKILVTHENAQYPLSIIVRVNTIVENAYINLSQATLVIKGSDTAYTVSASIENYNGYVDPESFKWTVPTGSEECMDVSISGNSIRIQGKKNGVFKINVAQEYSQYSRNLLVILEEQIGSAIDASMYITTSQNYVHTQIGAEPTTLQVRLVGGEVGDKKDFIWWVDKGENNGIATVNYVDGSVKDINTRAVGAVTSGKSETGELIIDPIGMGVLKITISHPRCLYDCEISVKVFSEYALLSPPKTIETEKSILKLLNDPNASNHQELVTATIKNPDEEGEENNVHWSSQKESDVSVSPAIGASTQVTACGTGQHQTYVTATLDGAYANKKILVLSADTQEELDSMKAIFSEVSYLRVSAKEEKTVELQTYGLIPNEDSITWSTADSSICIINPLPKTQSSFGEKATLKGIGAGRTTITATLNNCPLSQPVTFEVTVTPEGESADVIKNPKYLTTDLNAIVLENIGDTAQMSVTGINIPPEDMATGTIWTMEDVNKIEGNPVFELAGSPGDKANLTALRKGKSVITVSNDITPSQNSIKLNAKCGELYEWLDGYTIYITGDDVINILNDGQPHQIAFGLANTTESGTYSWSVTQGREKLDIIGLASGTATITPKEAGQAMLEVSNTLAVVEGTPITKEVLVNIANSPEELANFKYLTTSQNVINIGLNHSETITVNIKNTTKPITTGYSWVAENPNIIDISDSGSIANVYGKALGTTKLIVRNSTLLSQDGTDYPLEIIVNVIDLAIAANDPYIQCNNIVNCTVGDDPITIGAQLIGGVDEDNRSFQWTVTSSTDTNVIQLRANNEVAQVKALKEGTCQIVVSCKPKAAFDRTILVICEPKIETNYYITTSESIVKMKPSDSEKTITATLVNGTDEDAYDFKWWADSYEKININYTGSSCVITPLAVGSVNIHVSHPKAKTKKDIILYISAYSNFAFSQKNISIDTGSDTFVNMEVPTTGVDCDIVYSSSNSTICSISGNSTVCVLHPSLPDRVQSDTCTVTARLIAKDGTEQAKATMLVAVNKKDETKPYIAVGDNQSTIITMQKGEKRLIGAVLQGNGVIDTASAGLEWSINENGKNILQFKTQALGSTVQVEALASGETTIKVKHKEAEAPLTIYIIVPGATSPTVQLDTIKLDLIIAEEMQKIIASTQNYDGELTWSVTDEQGNEYDIKNVNDRAKYEPYFDFAVKDNTASLYPKDTWSGYINCKIVPPDGIPISKASCEIIIREKNQINIFIYDYADDDKVRKSDPENTVQYKKDTGFDSKKSYIDNISLYPSESRIIHYETVPKKTPLTNIVAEDYNYVNWGQGTSHALGLGYGAKNVQNTSLNPPSTGMPKYNYDENIGTIVLTGKAATGVTDFTITDENRQKDVISISNDYGDYFTIDSTIQTGKPTSKTDLVFNYEIRPGCAELTVTSTGEFSNTGDGLGTDYTKNIRLFYKDKNNNDAETEIENTAQDKNDQIIWKVPVTSHQKKGEANTSVAKGSLIFRVNGEACCRFTISAVNRNITTTGTIGIATSRVVGTSKTIEVDAYYKTHAFTLNDCQNVRGIFSKFNPTSNTIYIADGEQFKGTLNYSEANSSTSYVATFTPKANAKNDTKDNLNIEIGKTQSERVTVLLPPQTSQIGGMNSPLTVTIAHDTDYNKGTPYRDYTCSDTNDTLYEQTYIGTLTVYYTNFQKLGKTVTAKNYSAEDTNALTYSFAVFAQVRGSTVK